MAFNYSMLIYISRRFRHILITMQCMVLVLSGSWWLVCSFTFAFSWFICAWFLLYGVLILKLSMSSILGPSETEELMIFRYIKNYFFNFLVIFLGDFSHIYTWEFVKIWSCIYAGFPQGMGSCVSIGIQSCNSCYTKKKEILTYAFNIWWSLQALTYTYSGHRILLVRKVIVLDFW